MSLRPRAGAPNPARGGDGRRRRWSESPIPRVATRRVRMAGVLSGFYVEASLEAEFSEPYSGGYFVCELVAIGSPDTFTYSDPYPFTGTLPAETRLLYSFDLLAQYAGPWDYAQVRWNYGDGSATYYVFDGAYGSNPAALTGALEQDGTHPGRLIDIGGDIST